MSVQISHVAIMQTAQISLAHIFVSAILDMKEMEQTAQVNLARGLFLCHFQSCNKN